MDVTEKIIETVEQLTQARQPFERTFQDIVDYVRPMTSDVQRTMNPGSDRTVILYDDTAVNAAQNLASGLHSYIVNPAERFFMVGIKGLDSNEYDEETLLWLEIVSDVIFQSFSYEESGFNTAMHEFFLDIAGFGTGYPYMEWSAKRNCLRTRTFPVASCYIAEDSEGAIDTVMRKTMMTVNQIREQFPEKADEICDKKKGGEMLEISHIVMPRRGRDTTKLDRKNKAVASFWFANKDKVVLSEGGYEELPYMPGRWLVIAGEVYGTGPGRLCIDDVRLLNAQEKLILKAGNKMIDPPIVMPDEGFAGPVRTAAGGIIYAESGVDTEQLRVLEFRGNLPWAKDNQDQKREAVRRSFHSDWLQMEKENKEMTAYEVTDRRSEKLRLLAPNMSRIQQETISRLIRRAFNLHNERGLFPPVPAALKGKKLRVVYISPAARAQMAEKASEMSRYVADLVPLMQIKPDIMDAIDFDVFAKKLAEYRGTSRYVMRMQKNIDQIRADRAQQQQMQQMAEIAEPMSKALKNVADAKSMGMSL